MKRLLLTMSAVVCWATAAGAAAGPAASASSSATAYAAEVEALARAQAAIGDLAAEFTLTVKGGSPQERTLKAKGKIFLAAGRRYRVEYVSPEAQLLVSDGKQRWLYLKKINQVQKQTLPPAGNPQEFFLELGGGLAQWLKHAQITRVLKVGATPERWEYDCAPLSGETQTYQRARIWVRGENRLPETVEIDAEKSVRVTLSRVTIHRRDDLQAGGAGLPAKLFEFTPPADAEVVEPLWP